MEKISLNNEQKTAAEASLGPLLIVAGAGTGKTRTLMGRIAFFIEGGIPAEKICAITFTNKAAKEMENRLKTVLAADKFYVDGKKNDTKYKKPFIGTFHSLGARILRKECGNFGRGPNFTIFDEHDSFDLLKKVTKANFNKEGLDAQEKKEISGKLREGISNIKNKGTFIQKDKKSSIDENQLREAFDKYEQGLRENNAFDFDDLIDKVVRLFKAKPDILAKYQNMFDAILVDEYQDINPKQHEFVQLLAGAHKNLSVVGDDEQTIYGWRYADIGIFLNFEKEWPGARIFFLEENYRSTGSVIRAAASVAKNNRIRAPKNLWTKNPDGSPIILFEAWSEEMEAEWVSLEIEKIKVNNKKEQVGVLYRTNAQSRAIEQALIRRNIPYRVFGGLKFYERREIKDVVAGIRYAANPMDAISYERLEKNLTKRKFSLFKNRIEALKEMTPSEVIAIFMETFNYLEYVDNNFPNAEERRENVAELVSFASGFSDMSELLERLSLLQATDDENKSGEYAIQNSEEMVTLMTIHMSKGLEFDAVFIVGAAEGLLPHIRSIDKEASVEEERRLMYVAMTRARKKLFISFSGMPSRFLGEIPPDCIIIEDGNREENNKDNFSNTEDFNGEENYIVFD